MNKNIHNYIDILEKHGLRFGQIINNVNSELRKQDKDIFYIKEKDIEDILENFVKILKNNND